jgi:hypothetical protein
MNIYVYGGRLSRNERLVVDICLSCAGGCVVEFQLGPLVHQSQFWFFAESGINGA